MRHDKLLSQSTCVVIFQTKSQRQDIGYSIIQHVAGLIRLPALPQNTPGWPSTDSASLHKFGGELSKRPSTHHMRLSWMDSGRTHQPSALIKLSVHLSITISCWCFSEEKVVEIKDEGKDSLLIAALLWTSSLTAAIFLDSNSHSVCSPGFLLSMRPWGCQYLFCSVINPL